MTSRSAASGTRTARDTLLRKRSPNSATPATLTSCEAMSLLLFRSCQLAHRVRWIGRAHQSFANQHGVHADTLELFDLLASADAGLRHHRLPCRDGGEQADSGLDADPEVL